MIPPVREARAGRADRSPREFSYTAFSCRRQTSYPRFMVHDVRVMDRLGGFADDFNDRSLIACASSVALRPVLLPDTADGSTAQAASAAADYERRITA